MPETLTRIGRYEISRHVVDTALASVYDAFDPVERKPVAIRIPRTTDHGAPELRGLQHPGLMTVLSYEQNQGEPFAVLEPVQGTPLDSILHSGRKMEPFEIIALLRQLASVLDYAHTNGSFHGSLHPSGIRLNERHEIKVLDLGASSSAGRNASPEQLLRAIHYLSPECIRDQPMDGRADQFSLAVLAHDMLTGQLPFAGKSLGVMFRIAYQGLEREPIRELPPAAQTVFVRALSKRPAERYATCGEMVESLASALLRVAPAPTRILNPSEFPPEPPRTRPPAANRAGASRFFSRDAIKYFGVTFLVCALALGAIFYLLLPKPPKTFPVMPLATQPVVKPPAATPPATASPSAIPVAASPKPAQPSTPPPKAAPKVHAKKKADPEIDVKPAEPKIIR